MRFLTAVVVSACFSAGALSASASAGWCFPFPFMGGYGAGYASGPGYGAYYRGYAPMNYGASYYSAGHCGCAPCESSCCPSPCSTGCSTGCGGAVISDKVLDPVQDPGFRNGRDRTAPDGEDSRFDKRKYDLNEDGNEDDPLARPGRRTRPEFLGDEGQRLPEEEDAGGSRFRRRSDPPRGSGDDEFEDELSPGGRRRGTTPPFDEPEGGAGLPDLNPREFEEPLNRETQKPPRDAPIDNSDNPDDGEDDVVLPAPGEGEAAQLRLFRGVLSETQARTEHVGAESRVRLAGAVRSARQARSTRWSGRHSKQQRPLKWIAAPARDGRVRI